MQSSAVRTLLVAALFASAYLGIATAKEVRSELKVRVAANAPDFTLRASVGKQVTLSAFAGRIVLIDFYRAHW